jgi:chromosome segregation protein
MVKIEKLVVQGFKSFKRKASIPFPTGFSVITGPNGSGKSNIGDAISFVLGRSSSRTLRARKAKELIFHGSEKKEGSDFAKVALYFDNSSKVLPLEETSVSISRRINTQGVSVYRLNDKVVTRQQLVDVMNQAGIHPDGHNIIQQGDVNKIVEMDPIERREILDDISGISEYDEKKAKAEKELAKIDERVREAEIILQEKMSIMEKLESERNAALKYKELESNLSKIRASIIWKDYSGADKTLKEVSSSLVEKEKRSVELDKSISDFDNQIIEQEKGLEELTKSVIRASDQIEVSRKLARLQAEAERLQDKRESHEREIERIASIVEKLTTLDTRVNPALGAVKDFKGVCGQLSDLITVPAQYRTAADVAAGGHMTDIVTETSRDAIACVKHLKENKLGRARFLPLDKIRSYPQKDLPVGAIGWLSELIHHEPKHAQAIEFVFATTACVNDIDKARKIMEKTRVRMVTLDGDLLEASGAITGGFLRKKSSGASEASRYMEEKKKLAQDIEKIEIQLKDLNEDLEILAEKEKTTKTTNMERERVRLDETLRKLREERKEAYEERLILQQELGKLNIQKAKLEAKFDNLKLQWDERVDEEEMQGKKTNGKGYPKELEEYVNLNITTLKDKERHSIIEIQELGPINLKSLEDFESMKSEFDDFREKVDKIVQEKDAIMKTVQTIEEKRRETFMETLNGVGGNFGKVYKEIVGGEAILELETPDDINSGLMIRAQPPGKKLLNIDNMSGGEKTLTAFTFLFSIQRHKPMPFYVLDEADATLDRMNTKRIANLLKSEASQAQFLVISHNDALVGEADQVYGVTMEDGESKIMGIELPPEKKAKAAAA